MSTTEDRLRHVEDTLSVVTKQVSAWPIRIPDIKTGEETFSKICSALVNRPSEVQENITHFDVDNATAYDGSFTNVEINAVLNTYGEHFFDNAPVVLGYRDASSEWVVSTSGSAKQLAGIVNYPYAVAEHVDFFGVAEVIGLDGFCGITELVLDDPIVGGQNGVSNTYKKYLFDGSTVEILRNKDGMKWEAVEHNSATELKGKATGDVLAGTLLLDIDNVEGINGTCNEIAIQGIENTQKQHFFQGAPLQVVRHNKGIESVWQVYENGSATKVKAKAVADVTAGVVSFSVDYVSPLDGHFEPVSINGVLNLLGGTWGTGDDLVCVYDGIIGEWIALFTESCSTQSCRDQLCGPTSTIQVDTADNAGHVLGLVGDCLRKIPIDNCPPAESVMVWKGEWLDQEYQEHNVVTYGNWTMISNKITSDRAAPQDVGDPIYLYSGTNPTASPSAKFVLCGIKITSGINGFWLNGYRVYCVEGNNYSTHVVKESGEITELHRFTASVGGWVELKIAAILYPPGTSLKLISEVTKPNAVPPTFSGTWDYQTPNNNGIPGLGNIIHSRKETEDIRVSKTDNAPVDRGPELLGMEAGDIIDGAGMRWTIIDPPVDAGTYVSFHVSPIVNGSPVGLSVFSFEAVTQSPIMIIEDSNYWIDNQQQSGIINGLYSLDSHEVLENDNAYGIDLMVQEAFVSEDWEVVAYSG